MGNSACLQRARGSVFVCDSVCIHVLDLAYKTAIDDVLVTENDNCLSHCHIYCYSACAQACAHSMCLKTN